ncbi:hypothetical protein FNV43_RR13841 [Rhamnella rubrinervis]|uniref:Uncharacterized protein n=1 Tax=Rhamnella rubrinervis TaxID=2594499 RepID=A0A8K0H1R6_9ROSA|nr:hypothetical protein FNV43_RR13841 [Rhamnella rubrinervis]
MEANQSVLRGQAEIWKYMFSFVDSMALRCAVDFRIADIIHSHSGPITLSQIVSSFPSDDYSSPPDITSLARIMRLLVRRNIFTATAHHSNGEDHTLYGLTDSSRWLLHDSELSLGPIVLMQTQSWLMAPWHRFSQCVKEGGIAFNKTHGRDLWQFMSENSDFNKLFNDGMECSAKIVLKTIISEYKSVFDNITSLVDVGGGTGVAIAEIVKSCPHIHGINFDLPHVIATAPVYPGVSHVQGDMFKCIPRADVWIMHDWSDEDCVKILKNCKKAMPERNGKLIIVDAVLEAEGDDLFDDTRLVFDLVMLVHCPGGKERTKIEWEKLLKQGGFSRYNIIKIPALPSIIEAYPQ